MSSQCNFAGWSKTNEVKRSYDRRYNKGRADGAENAALCLTYDVKTAVLPLNYTPVRWAFPF
jgi:hypothetical protein